MRRPHLIMALSALALGIIGVASVTCRREPSGPDLVRRTEPMAKEGTTDPSLYPRINDFSLNFFRAIDKDRGNRTFAASPFGAYITLAVFANAAEGKTLGKVGEAMFLDKVQTGDLTDGVQFIQDRLYGAPSLPFASHNAIFMVWPIMLSREFKDEMDRNFKFEITRLGSAGIGAENRMNEWVANRTNGSMDGMVQPVDKEVVFLALNPVHVGAPWRQGFDRSLTVDRAFEAPLGPQIVKMMERTGNIMVAETDDWVAVTLDYKAMVQATFVLPKKEAARALLGRMNSAMFKKMVSGRAKPITLWLPRFSVDDDHHLQRYAAATKTEFLYQAPLDLRYMSVEMQGDYVMSDWHQRIQASFSEVGDPPEGPAVLSTQKIVFDRPFLWFVSEGSMDVIAAGGIYAGQDQK